MLEGHYINVRVLEREDLPLFTSWNNDPEFGGEFEKLEQRSLHEVEKWYETLGPDEKWFIIEKKDGQKVGQIKYVKRGSCFTIGYRILPEERRKGYCTEAVKILVDFLFLSKDIVRIESEVNPENVNSWKVLENAGFTREGIRRRSFFARGKWRDDAIYSILREEWKEPKILKG